MQLPSFVKPLRISRKRVLWKLTKVALDQNRPVLVQIVVTRRCNLACGHCYEYDKVSKPVPLPELKAWVDALRKLKTVFVTLNGASPCCTRSWPNWCATSRRRAWCICASPKPARPPSRSAPHDGILPFLPLANFYKSEPLLRCRRK